MKNRKPEIKLGEFNYPDYEIKFELIKTGTKQYIFIYHKSRRKGKVRIKENVIESFVAFISFLKNSINLNLSINDAKKVFSSFNFKIDLSDEKINDLLASKQNKNKKPTPVVTVSKTEDILAKYLKKLKIPFKRQVRIGNYIVDFLIEPNIVVEVEGLVHYRKDVIEKDYRRVNYLESQGYIVYRFYSRNIKEDPKGIAKTIYEIWKGKTPTIQRIRQSLQSNSQFNTPFKHEIEKQKAFSSSHSYILNRLNEIAKDMEENRNIS
jgi:very-short-patch-repair endonuclease